MPPHGKIGQAYKAQHFKKSFKRLALDFKPQYPLFIIVAIFLIASAIFTVVCPLLLRNILNGLEGDILTVNPDMTISINWTNTLTSFGLMLGLYVASALFNWAADFIIVTIAAKYAYNLRSQVRDKLDKLPLSYFDSHTYGTILTRGTADVDTISQSLRSIINQTIYSIALLISVIIAMLVSSWELALIAFAIMPVTIAVTITIAIKAQKQFSKYRTKLSQLEGVAEENFSGYKVIKLFNMEEKTQKDFAIVNEELTHADRWSQFLSSLIFPSMRFISNLGFVFVCVVGGLLDDIANMVAFFLFLNLFQQPFQNIGQISSTIQSTVAAGERIYDLLDQEEETPDREDAINDESVIKGEMILKDVAFSYTKDKPLIENLNLEVHPGDSVAIVGPTGAGKTTIVNLLMRFYDIDNGQIILDGHETREYTRKALRGAVGMVLQDTWLFEGTIKDNIRYGRQDATDEEVIDAAKKARAHHFIKTLPGGYDFMLNEDGTNISQGQRQLLTIARAMISKPRMLILDEATSSVDTRTEVEIQSVMNKMMEGKTSFIIAHRLSTIKNAKMILVMNKGKIIEKGNHKTLLAQNGFYAELYNAQFSGRNPIAPQEESDT